LRMNGLRREIAAFLKDKETREAQARQMAALQIACHFDLAEALAAEPEARALIVLRLERMIERERQRGARKHWSYDLNRHIALKQALDSLRTATPDAALAGCKSRRVSRSAKTRRRPKAPPGTAGKASPRAPQGAASS
jgi:hypothetical protein